MLSFEIERETRMFRIWQMIHPMRALTFLYIFLALLALTIHFILLSTDRYNWLQAPGATSQSMVIERIVDHA